MNKTSIFLFASLMFWQTGSAQTITATFQHDGLERDYRLHLPPGFDPSEELPLVFNLHGLTSNATQQEFYSEMNEVADTARFIVCYPNGVNSSWNIGQATADDLGFLNALIDHLHTEYNINLARVYSCGMSNGGFMSYQLACQLSGRIAAIASVTGSMTADMKTDCEPERPVPVMEIHGTADPIVAYGGSFFNLGTEEIIDFWAETNACPGSPITTAYPDTDTGDQSTAERITHADCELGSEVVLIKVDNGGHTWPGAPINVGTTCMDFEASVEIWNFFNRFTLALPLPADERLPEGKNIASPNPFGEELRLRQIPASTSHLIITDSRGSIVWQSHAFGDLGIETNGWPSGIYFLRGESEAGVFSEKLVKLK